MSQNASLPPDFVRPDSDYSMLQAAIILAQRKKMIIGSTLAAAVVAGTVCFFLPNIYTGTAQVLPPQQQSGASALLGQLSSLSGAVGQSLGVKNPNDTYVAMLNSRTISDQLIKRFQLAGVYETKTVTDTRRALAGATSVFSGKDGIISIQVDDESAKRAAEIANAYVEELQKLTQTLAITEASQRRLFFEKQLLKAKNELANAESALKEVQERTGLIQLTGQSEGIIKAAAELKASIGAKEVMLGAMRTFATRSNPEYLRIEQELSGLRAQLRKIETGLNSGNGDVSIATSKVPAVGLEYVRKVRDLKYAETIFELLAKQFELAKIDEAKESSIIQVLDIAVEPDKKTRPARGIIILGSALLAGLIAAVAALVAGRVDRSNPAVRGELDALRRALGWRVRAAG